jgi:hypothetical protein
MKVVRGMMRREAQGIPEYATRCCQHAAASRRITPAWSLRSLQALFLAASLARLKPDRTIPGPRLRTCCPSGRRPYSELLAHGS